MDNEGKYLVSVERVKPGRKPKPKPNEPFTLCSVKIPNSEYIRFQVLAKQNKEPLRDVVIKLAIQRLNQIENGVLI